MNREYKRAGRVDTIETAVRRAVVTGVNQTCAKLQEERADQMGSDLVETTAHGGARPSHAVWQGKIFSRSGKSRKYPKLETETGYGTGAGLCGWNCRHSFFPYFEGISERAYSDRELKEYNAQKYEYNGQKMTEYEATQTQRGIERNIRRWKREKSAMAAAGLPTEEASAKIRSWQEREKDFLRQTGLKKQYGRSQVGGYGRKEAIDTTKSAEGHYKAWINSISSDGTPKTLADYYDMKYNNPKEYELLQGYVKAVEKGDISPLTGFEKYREAAKEVEDKLIGIKVNDIEMKSYATHFIDRIIGQTDEPHEGMRTGVSVDIIRQTLENPVAISAAKSVRMPNSKDDVRIKITGERCYIVISEKDQLFIQVNPRGGK